MIDKIHINYLLDFYGSLLTEKQQNICKLYFYEDYSLAEIAELFNTSRNAVFDTIKRSEKTLNNLEEKLKCYSSYLNRMSLYKILKEKNDIQINNIVDKLIETEIKEDKYE